MHALLLQIAESQLFLPLHELGVIIPGEGIFLVALLQNDLLGCFVLISARYRINPQITSSTMAPRSDRKKPAG